jgi:micrococcal nuclease
MQKRRKNNRKLLTLIVAFFIIVTPFVISKTHHLFAQTPKGLFVKKVFDGDTILLSDDRVVRYIGIDTPESGGLKPVEYYGIEAKKLNEELTKGKVVRLEMDVERIDKYGRTLAYVYVDEIFVNLKLVELGAAVARPYPPNLKYHKELAQKMELARNKKLGFWADVDKWMITAKDAGSHIGLSKTVVGRVLHSDGKSFGVFLNFGNDFSKDFTVFIPNSNLAYFADSGIYNPAFKYLDKIVEITGTIREKNGPSIAVKHPDQIFIRR